MARKPILTDRCGSSYGQHGPLEVIEDLGGSKRVRHRDGHEAELTDDLIINAVNSSALRIAGDWYLTWESGPFHLCMFRVGYNLESRAGTDPTQVRPTSELQGFRYNRTGGLAFRDWEALAAWSAGRQVPQAWTTDRFGGWVPVDFPYATSTEPARPCTSCGRRAPLDATLCAMHAAGKARRDEGDRQRQERWAAQAAQRRRDAQSDRAAGDWAERIAQEFKVAVRPAADGSGNVTINPEGLYALLVGVARDAPWLLDDLPAELRLRPPADAEGAAAS